MAMAISSPSYNLTFLLPRSGSLQPLSLTPPSCSFFAQPLRNLSLKFCAKIQSVGVGREGPASDPKAGVSLYKPKSYEVLVSDAANSLSYALQDGKLRLEIDFPYIHFHFLHLNEWIAWFQRYKFCILFLICPWAFVFRPLPSNISSYKVLPILCHLWLLLHCIITTLAELHLNS